MELSGRSSTLRSPRPRNCRVCLLPGRGDDGAHLSILSSLSSLCRPWSPSHFSTCLGDFSFDRFCPGGDFGVVFTFSAPFFYCSEAFSHPGLWSPNNNVCQCFLANRNLYSHPPPGSFPNCSYLPLTLVSTEEHFCSSLTLVLLRASTPFHCSPASQSVVTFTNPFGHFGSHLLPEPQGCQDSIRFHLTLCSLALLAIWVSLSVHIHALIDTLRGLFGFSGFNYLCRCHFCPFFFIFHVYLSLVLGFC